MAKGRTLRGVLRILGWCVVGGCTLFALGGCGGGSGSAEGDLYTTPTPVPTESPELSRIYPVVDTGQTTCYDSTIAVTDPAPGEDFYGQDAQLTGNAPSYRDNQDGTVTDTVTGLMWEQSPDRNGDGIINAEDKLTLSEAREGAASCTTGGYTDWRLPTIKELYSLILFSGVDPSGYEGSDTDGLVPFIDTSVFVFGYGDTGAGERIIDAQFASSTTYVSTTMQQDATVFGVNFADGRIKGYGYSRGKTFYVFYVRGNENYGINAYLDNQDGTISDLATELMWAARDSGEGFTWKEALAWVQQKNQENYLGYSDWRLPNVKELQSIVDYGRSPDTSMSPAVDSLFHCTAITNEGGAPDYPFYWSGTTHANFANGNYAAYVAFGRGLGWMQEGGTGTYELLDVHGAGCQRSDPKAGDPGDYPYGHGPQGDVIRIYNYVRLVRDI